MTAKHRIGRKNKPRPVPDLMTMADIAAFTGLTLGAIRWHRAHGNLPNPDGFVGQSPYWRLNTVKAWKRPPVGRTEDSWTVTQRRAHSAAMTEYWHTRRQRRRCEVCDALLSPDEQDRCRDCALAEEAG